jgi:hypothetical protein
MAQYLGRLPQEAPHPCSVLLTTGRAAAARLLPARLLRNAEVCAGRRGGPDAARAGALDTRESTVPRVRHALVEPGGAAA